MSNGYLSLIIAINLAIMIVLIAVLVKMIGLIKKDQEARKIYRDKAEIMEARNRMYETFITIYTHYLRKMTENINTPIDAQLFVNTIKSVITLFSLSDTVSVKMMQKAESILTSEDFTKQLSDIKHVLLKYYYNDAKMSVEIENVFAKMEKANEAILSMEDDITHNETVLQATLGKRVTADDLIALAEQNYQEGHDAEKDTETVEDQEITEEGTAELERTEVFYIQ